MNPQELTKSPDFTLVHRIIPAIVAVIIVVAVVELIRRRKLREEYAMLWLLASAVLLIFAVYPKLLWLLQKWLGVFYLTIMVLGSFFFLMLLTLRLGISISRLTDDSRQIAQRLSLLERKLEKFTSSQIDDSDGKD